MAQQVAQCSTHKVVSTDSGEWIHAPGTDFAFAFLPNDMDEKVKADVTKAFVDAMAMSSEIKKAVKQTTGKDVVNGLYTVDQASMIEAMNSIEGMGQTSSISKSESGSGTAVEINQEFFVSVLAGLSGDAAPLTAYLTQSMGDVQAEAKKSEITENFGTVFGLVSLMPVLNVPVITFKYAYSSSETSKWFVSVNCGSVAKHSYDYSYTTVDYNYVKPSTK